MKLDERLVLALVGLQVLVTGFLWTLDPTGRGAQATFATLLGVDLVAFAVISYLYRTGGRGEVASNAWLLSGLVALGALLLSALLTAG